MSPGERDAAPTRALLACLSLAAGPAPERLPVPWREIVEEAERREVEALLFTRLRERADVPPALLEHLAWLHAVSALRNRKLYLELEAILHALGDAGVEAVLLKGVYLARALYQDPALRVMSDIDLLVRPECATAAFSALLQLGYSPRVPLTGAPSARWKHLPSLCRPGAVPVELHQRLVSLPLELDTAAIWARSEPARLDGIPARALAPTDLLLHLCLHAAQTHKWETFRHGAFPLRALYDIALVLDRLAPRIEWEELQAQAESAGAAEAVFCAILVAQRLLGAPLPAEVAARLAARVDAVRLDTLERLLAASTPPDVPFIWRDPAFQAGRLARLRALLGTVFPTPERLRAMYALPAGSRRVYLYYPVRVLDLVRRRGTFVAALALGAGRARKVVAQERRRRMVAGATGAR